MIVHPGLPPGIKFASNHLHSCVAKGTVKEKCLGQEHNTMSSARARTQTARSGVERTNHEVSRLLWRKLVKSIHAGFFSLLQKLMDLHGESVFFQTGHDQLKRHFQSRTLFQTYLILDCSSQRSSKSCYLQEILRLSTLIYSQTFLMSWRNTD